MVTLSPGAQWNGTPGRPNHPTAPLCCGKPIKSPPDKADGQYHLLPFLGEIISTASDLMGWFLLQLWPFCQPAVGGWCWISHAVKLPETQNAPAGVGPMISLVWCSEHHILLCVWPSKFYKMGSWQGCEVFIFCVKTCQVKSWHIFFFYHIEKT